MQVSGPCLPTPLSSFRLPGHSLLLPLQYTLCHHKWFRLRRFPLPHLPYNCKSSQMHSFRPLSSGRTVCIRSCWTRSFRLHRSFRLPLRFRLRLLPRIWTPCPSAFFLPGSWFLPGQFQSRCHSCLQMQVSGPCLPTPLSSFRLPGHSLLLPLQYTLCHHKWFRLRRFPLPHLPYNCKSSQMHSFRPLSSGRTVCIRSCWTRSFRLHRSFRLPLRFRLRLLPRIWTLLPLDFFRSGSWFLPRLFPFPCFLHYL